MPPKEKINTKNKGISQSSTSTSASTSAPDSSAAAARSNDRYEEVRDGLATGFGIVKDISEGTEMLAPLKATCLLLVRGLELTKSINDNKKDWIEFKDRLKVQSKRFDNELRKQEAAATARKGASVKSPSLSALEAYHNELQEILVKVEAATSYSQAGVSGLFRRVLRSRIDPEEIKRWTAHLDDAYKSFTSSLMLVISEQVEDGNQRIRAIHEIVKNPINHRQTSRPMRYPQDSLNTSIHGLDLEACQAGTQSDTLGCIRQWGDDKITTKQILWLSGGKGIGKTTVAVTMSREWESQGLLAGRFFFSSDSMITSTTTEFCRAVSRDMAAHISPLRTVIQAAIKATPPDHYPLEYQLQKMVIEPLEQYEKSVFIVVDGLESVPTEVMRDRLLVALLAELPRIPKLKLLISSEPLMDIEDRLGTSDLVERHDLHLHDNSDGTIDHDVTLYIESNLNDLTECQKTTFATLSMGRFLWLAPATTMLRKSRMKNELIQHMIKASSQNQLDGLYCIALKQAEHAMWPSGLRMKLMRIVISLLEPLPLTTICLLLRIPQKQHFQVSTMVHTILSGFLKAGDPNSSPVRVRHTDFRDFCLDPLRSKEFYVDSFISHSYLALVCLELLEPFLEYNLLHIELCGVLPWNDELFNLDVGLEKFLRAHPTAAYASSYWPYHMAIALQNQELHFPFIQFLSNQILHWVEFMSWRGCVGQAIDGLCRLQRALRAHLLIGPEAAEMENLTTQALSFVQQGRAVIERSALHVYCSALGFAAEDSSLVHQYRETYEDKYPKVIVMGQPPVKGHRSIANSSSILEISPDGRIIATSSSDFIISLWVSSTGAPYEKRLSGHKSEVTSLSFSGDSQFLVSGSRDGQFRIWNTKNGSQIHLVDQSGTITDVRFSPDTSSISIISRDTKRGSKPVLHVWNSVVSSERIEPSVRFTCTEPFKISVFSSNGKYIASITDKGLFQVFDAMSGTLRSSRKTDIQASHIAISSDGELAAISNDLLIQLWDVSSDTGIDVDQADEDTSTNRAEAQLLATMPVVTKGNRDALSISPNGRYLVHASAVWRIDTLPPSFWSATRSELPPGLRWYATGPGSLLSFEDGWIHSAHPTGHLVEVSGHYGLNSSTPWRAQGSKLVFAPNNGEIVAVDCSPLLS